jgi:hypothetical protein
MRPRRITLVRFRGLSFCLYQHAGYGIVLWVEKTKRSSSAMRRLSISAGVVAAPAAIALGSRVSPYSSCRAFSASTRPSVKMISQSPGASVTVADSYFAAVIIVDQIDVEAGQNNANCSSSTCTRPSLADIVPRGSPRGMPYFWRKRAMSWATRLP